VHGFAASVDQVGGVVGVGRPVGDKSPAKNVDVTSVEVGVGQHGDDVLGRRDVESRLNIWHHVEKKLLGNAVWSNRLDKSATHEQSYSEEAELRRKGD